MKNIPAEFSVRVSKLCSMAAAAAGFRPCPASAADSPSASAIALPATSSEVFAVLLVLVLAVIYAARLMITVVLIAVAPLALACHALPQAEGIARWWWRAFAGILAIQCAQAVVLVAALRLFFTEQWTALAAPPGTVSSFDSIQLLCLLYILIRIPFWIGRRVWSPGGRSPLRSAARFVFYAAVLRRIAPTLSGRAARRPGATGGSTSP